MNKHAIGPVIKKAEERKGKADHPDALIVEWEEAMNTWSVSGRSGTTTRDLGFHFEYKQDAMQFAELISNYFIGLPISLQE